VNIDYQEKMVGKLEKYMWNAAPKVLAKLTMF
jgi:hypothetical protein